MKDVFRVINRVRACPGISYDNLKTSLDEDIEVYRITCILNLGIEDQRVLEIGEGASEAPEQSTLRLNPDFEKRLGTNQARELLNQIVAKYDR